MARARKQMEVGEVHHKTRTQPVKIFYDRDTERFHGTVAEGRIISAETQRECERKIHEEIEATLQLAWRQIIVVTHLEPFNHHSDYVQPFVGFQLRRHEVARLPDGPEPHQKDQWVERDFRDPETGPNPMAAEGQEKGWDIKKFHYPQLHGNRKTVIPYTKETWRGLQALQERIIHAGEQLTALLAHPDLPKVLERVAVSNWLLPISGTDPKPQE